MLQSQLPTSRTTKFLLFLELVSVCFFLFCFVFGLFTFFPTILLQKIIFHVFVSFPFHVRTYLSLCNVRSWYREGSNTILQAVVLKGGSKDQPTNATLSIVPRREDDGAKYKCVVWNRAMNEGQRLETTATLNVNCK